MGFPTESAIFISRTVIVICEDQVGMLFCELGSVSNTIAIFKHLLSATYKRIKKIH